MAKKKIIQQTFIREKSEGSGLNPLILPSVLTRNPFVVFSILCILALIYVFNQYFFGGRLYLFKDVGSDTINIFLPQYLHLSDYIAKDGWPAWSFAEGMGQNISGFTFGTPTTLLLTLTGKEALPGWIVYTEAAKLFLAGTCFFYFLKSMNLNALTCIIGGLLYAFSGFMVVGSGWYQFSYEGLCMAFLLLSLEKFTSKNNILLLPLAFALIASNQPFNLLAAGMISAGFILFRSFMFDFRFTKEILQKLIFCGGLIALGIGISAFFFWVNVDQMLQSPRGSGEASYYHFFRSRPILGFAESSEYISTILRTFGNDLAGNGLHFGGWTNYLEAPMTYCGLLTLILAPQFFTTTSGSIRKAGMILTVLVLTPLVFPYFRFAFWLYSGDYYRLYSLLVIMLLIILSSVALHEIINGQKPHPKILFGTLGISLLILFYPDSEKNQVIDSDLRLIISFFLLLHAGVVWMLGTSYKKPIALICIPIVLVELSFLSHNSVTERRTVSAAELKTQTGYNDNTKAALEYLHTQDKSFYRINKDYNSGLSQHSSLNDAKAQGYFGTSSYHSFPQKNYVRFLTKEGITKEGDELQARWIQGVLSRTLLHSITSSKYILSKKPDSYPRGMGYDSIATFGDVKVWKNLFYLPLGFTYSNMIPYSEFRSISSQMKDRMLLSATVVETETPPSGLQKANLADTSATLSFAYLRTLVDSLKMDTLGITHFSNNKIEGKIHLDRSKMLFLSIPFDEGWTCTDNEKLVTLERVNLGFTGIMLDKGDHQVRLTYTVPHLDAGRNISIASLLGFSVLVFFRRRLNPLLKPE